MAFLIPSIQFFFGLPRALFCFGIHFNAITQYTCQILIKLEFSYKFPKIPKYKIS